MFGSHGKWRCLAACMDGICFFRRRTEMIPFSGVVGRCNMEFFLFGREGEKTEHCHRLSCLLLAYVWVHTCLALVLFTVLYLSHQRLRICHLWWRDHVYSNMFVFRRLGKG